MSGRTGWLLLKALNEPSADEDITPEVELPDLKVSRNDIEGLPVFLAAVDALRFSTGPWLCQVPLNDDCEPGVGWTILAPRKGLMTGPADISLFLRQFAGECAERVLPIYEKRYPHDDRPRQAVEAAQKFATVDASKKTKDLESIWRKALTAAKIAASIASESLRETSIEIAARDAADAALWALSSVLNSASESARNCSFYTLRAIRYINIVTNANYLQAETEERDWQEQKLTQYFEICLRENRLARLQALDNHLG